MKSKVFLVGMAALAFGLALAGCGNDRSIQGAWVMGEETLIFHSNGRFEWRGWDWHDEGAFTARNGRITLVDDKGDDYTGTYVISGNALRLELEGRSGRMEYTFRRM